MIPALNPVTVGGWSIPFLEFLDAASGAGFPAVDYSIGPFAETARVRSPEAAAELLAERKLTLGSFGLPVEFRKDEDTFASDLRKLPELARLAKRLGADRCCTWLWPATDDPVAEHTSRFIRRLRACASVLDDCGLRFGIEWVGTKTLRTMKHDFIHTLPGVLELIGAIDRLNVGVLFDSFHWFTSGGTREDILALRPEQIVLVHINDAPDQPIDEQIDDRRLLPGEGIIDLDGMLSALRSIGYDSFVSAEVFSDTLPRLGAAEAARRTKASLDRVLAVG
ncbi:sugar phosphate isomerase/epimerase family protein [Paenibacillus sp.]|uniref:sugar phosphate isomerase/epimerase family protein n=1 Tax=Paenibacillus sp. TaxID=58172 RepID=UPI002D3D312F|nr:sugar phosphate isomerase/epimerase family protein [Paenibacillus sp.]HZG88161.1 sugar phosphate isomerase/epimerase family protein [Paenibacillus sp.]